MTDSRFPLDGRLPDMLRSGKPLRGLFNGLPSPAIVEMCAYAGFDFIILDNEHGSAGFGMTEDSPDVMLGFSVPLDIKGLKAQ